MRSPLIVSLLGCLLVLSLVAGGVVGASGPTAGGAPDIDTPTEPILVYDIALDADGTATWNVSVRFPITNQSQQAAFDRVVTAYEADDGDEYLPIEPYEATVEVVGPVLNRSMEIHSVNRTVVETDAAGHLVLEFTWDGFAAPGENELTVGDVFQATEQTWLSRLHTDEYLLIRAPDNYTVQSSGMPVHERTMWVRGPVDLSDTALSATFVTASNQTTQPPDEPDDSVSPLLIGGAGVLLALLSLLALAYQRGYRPTRPTPVESVEVPAESSDPAPVATTETAEDGIDPELLSDEERVLHLIEERGGRMKQATIVTETDWSNAKVSQLLSQMANDGTIEKLRIGRENLISLPGEEEDRKS